MLPSSWQRSIKEKLRKRAIPINWPCLFNNIRRCAIWKIVEEQLDLPARFVKFGDGEGVEGEIVGEEHQPLTGLRIIELDPAQWTVETLARIEAGQENCLIAHQPGRAIDGSRIAAASLEIGLGASDKETSGIIETRKPLEIDIASVHNIEGASFGKKLIQNVDIMHLAITDEDKRGDIAAQIEQRMEFYGGLGGSERCPRKHREAEIDCCRIQRIDSVVEVKRQRIIRIEPPRNADAVSNPKCNGAA